jgi:hypothetical protein
MQFDNATNLDRKSGVVGRKRRGEAPTIAFVRATRARLESRVASAFVAYPIQYPVVAGVTLQYRLLD